VSTVFAEKTLFFAFKAVSDDRLCRAVRASWFGCKFLISQRNGNSVQQRRNFILQKLADITNKQFSIGHGIILLNIRIQYQITRVVKWSYKGYQLICGLTPLLFEVRLKRVPCSYEAGDKRMVQNHINYSFIAF